MRVFEPFPDPLVNDGFIEFGAIDSRNGNTEEVLVKASKYLCVWTCEPARVSAVLMHFGLQSVPDLQFLDEFPYVTETLPGEASRHHEVIAAIVHSFASLPVMPKNAG